MLSSKLKEAWYSIIPLEIYLSWSLIKIRVGLGKWKKSHDKKQVLKERTLEKEAKMMMKKYDY
jgi:SsrA-binding protein